MYYFLSDALPVVAAVFVGAIYFVIWWGLSLVITRGIVRGVVMKTHVLNSVKSIIPVDEYMKRHNASTFKIILLSIAALIFGAFSIYMISYIDFDYSFLGSFGIIGGLIFGITGGLSIVKKEEWIKLKIQAYQTAFPDSSSARV